ncbi:DUF4387 domain-containing protein [Paenibacillus sp. J5C_2022]|uniref:DUF4387 domain-containing protein n=1 Tax=Paenibacillus sp. J5C2022 TaxID=2977129 RepID=UPI0021CEE4A8|nr:DUF4387 domain-containing protein [Paenibacillus sp. J5C2022]MCU6711611.1 DUF4387 domain-containing protein [Paenibacillus sp. J5C2022]
MTQLAQLAKVLRSKNSGPFELTMDVLFDNEESYYKVKRSGVISKDTICRIYQIKEEQIHHLVFFDQALGFKVTISRDVSSGTVGDRDVYGAQQHAPLMTLDIGEEGG